MSDQTNASAASSSPALPAQNLISCGDISCEFLVNPIPRPKPAPFKVTIKPEKQEVVLMDNDKPNSMEILRRTRAVLRARGVAVREEILCKNVSAAYPVNGDLFDKLSREKGLVLSGVND